EKLLRADAKAHDFMEHPPASVADTAAAFAGSAVPEAFGVYRVVRSLGQGGMGEVWLAERGDGEFDQRVAVKRLTYPTPGLLQRFRQERQILARLEHPNIARLIDGGVGADGTPYLVMEYVEGVPITTFARERALDVPALLRLMLRVCEAVQYAHQNLVVHRDLKPSNIFVTGDGNPKLLDFGIAKVLSTTDVDAPTQTVARLLTPDYAAPEQFSGAPVTTATDVYALGVVLYELLAGRRPFRRDGAHPDAHDPPAPSLALERTTGANAARRRELRGDVDRIALTAIAHSPARRYASAEALAADIRRYLDGRPIAARGDSAWYRLGKFARRNRYALAAAVLVFAVSISATAISLAQARRAQEQAARAEAVRKFLVGVFAQASPDESKGKPITAQELLEKSEPQIDKELAGQPALRADIAALLASLYVDIGNLEPAQTLLKQIIDGSDAARVPPVVRSRALTELAGIERDKHESDAAFAHAREALTLATAADAVDEASEAQHMINQIMVVRGDAKAAEPQLRATLAADLARLGEMNDAVADDYSMLGTSYDEMTRYDESAAAFAKTIEISRALHGSQHNTTARALNDLGLMLLHKGDLAGAERALRETNEIAIQLYGIDTDNTWTTRSNLLRVLELQGRYREALAERQAIFEAEQRLVGEKRPDALAFASNFIGVDHRELGELDASETALRRALALWARIQGSNDEPSSTTPLMNLAITLSLKGRYADAERSIRSALAIQEKHQTSSSQWLNISRGHLGDILRLQHRYAEALTELRTANTAMQSAGGTPNPWLALLGAQLAEAELDAGHAEEAHRIATGVLAAARKSLPQGNVRLGPPLFALARADLAIGDAHEAESLAREAIAIRIVLLPAYDPRLLEAEITLVGALAAEDRSAEAKALLRQIEPALARLATPYAADLRGRVGSI
ncbi:MAG TPA: serine/threonine-protein kinase, partial [Rhodanobacteraceae bacterium]|nr:serine/threonine-protein kinase [Rhodanobacteraceae bacterium]